MPRVNRLYEAPDLNGRRASDANLRSHCAIVQHGCTHQSPFAGTLPSQHPAENYRLFASAFATRAISAYGMGSSNGKRRLPFGFA